MADKFRLTLAQLNPTVGDMAGNAAKAKAAWDEGKAAGADMVALPEMFLTGYQTQDLVRKPAFVADAQKVLMELAGACADGPVLAIGSPVLDGERLYNAYFYLKGGEVQTRFDKHFLPNFNVFDEVRLFNRGPLRGPAAIGNDGPRMGSPICEDAWYPDVCEALSESGAEVLLVPNGSPYFRDKFPRMIRSLMAGLLC